MSLYSRTFSVACFGALPCAIERNACSDRATIARARSFLWIAWYLDGMAQCTSGMTQPTTPGVLELPRMTAGRYTPRKSNLSDSFDLARFLLGHFRAALADAERGESDVDTLGVRRNLVLESVHVDNHLQDLRVQGGVRLPARHDHYLLAQRVLDQKMNDASAYVACRAQHHRRVLRLRLTQLASPRLRMIAHAKRIGTGLSRTTYLLLLRFYRRWCILPVGAEGKTCSSRSESICRKALWIF
jgi:hypothetical protein